MKNKHINTDISTKKIDNILYTVSYHDIVQNWIDLYHSMDTVIVLYDPINHIEYIKNFGFQIPEDEIFESKILVVIVPDLDDAIWVIKKISHTHGPFTQVWSLGRCITDNIEK